MANEPLGLPRGSVRAILTLLLVVAAIAAAFLPLHGNEAAQSSLLVLAGVAVRDYFGNRTAQNAEDGPPLAKPSINGQE